MRGYQEMYLQLGSLAALAIILGALAAGDLAFLGTLGSVVLGGHFFSWGIQPTKVRRLKRYLAEHPEALMPTTTSSASPSSR
jgi:hypothetical protein